MSPPLYPPEIEGYPEVANLAALAGVVTTSLVQNTGRRVVDIDDFYFLDKVGPHVADGLSIVDGSGGGWWLSFTEGDWDDLQGDVTEGDAAGALTYDVFRNTAWRLKCMSHTQDDTLHFRFQMPHAWKAGTDVRPHLHVIPLADPAVPQNVVVDGYYVWARVGLAVPALIGWTAFLVNLTVNPGEVYQQKIVNLGLITPPGGFAESSLLLIYLRRPGASDANDTYSTNKDHATPAANLGVVSIDVHYRKDKIGTRLELANG